MKEELRLFENEEFGSVRVVEINEEVWFVGKDIAHVLGYENQNRDIVTHVDDEDRFMMDKTQYENGIEFDYRQLGQRGGWLINESGLYSLILSSKLDSAKKFKRWVTSEVLPSIRKHGAYMTEDTIEKALTSPDFLIELATKLKEEQEARRLAESKVVVVEEKLQKAQNNDRKFFSETEVVQKLNECGLKHLSTPLLHKWFVEVKGWGDWQYI